MDNQLVLNVMLSLIFMCRMRKRRFSQHETEKKCQKEKVNFKMAHRKQPDRQVKKKRKIEMPETLEITKRKRKLEESRKFDIVGNLLRNYGMTGENLVHDIFSYMDASSLEGKEFGTGISLSEALFFIN